MINTNDLRRTGEIAKEKSLSDSGQVTAGKMLKRAADTIDQQAALIKELNDKISFFTSSVPAVEIVDGMQNQIDQQAALIVKYEEALKHYANHLNWNTASDPLLCDWYQEIRDGWEVAEQALAKEDTTP